MKAKEFNRRFSIGARGIYQPYRDSSLFRVVRTLDIARDLKAATVVEINCPPYFVRVESLTMEGDPAA